MNITDEDKELFFKFLTDDKTENKIDNCLISNTPLTENHITLKCNHKFNYDSLLRTVIIQKLHANPLNNISLSVNEIQCPYCRTIQNKLLPFIPTDTYKKRIRCVTGPPIFCMEHMQCTWKFKAGKQKNKLCLKQAYKGPCGIYCQTHQKIKKRDENLLPWNEEMEVMKKYTIPQLKDILHKLNLKKTGNKGTLIQRVYTHQKS